MNRIAFSELEGRTVGYYVLLGCFVLLALVSVASAWTIEQQGHWITGMNNQTPWGLPHIFSVFFILSGAGAFVVAAMHSVFCRPLYRPVARLSGLLALALLVSGIAVLLLDLGRPERVTIAMTTFNFTSALSTNVFRYTAFMIAVGFYLWTTMEPRLDRYSRPLGIAAFLLGVLLATGIGAELGFLVARKAYDSAIMPPMFVAMSMAFGLACFILVLVAVFGATGRDLGGDLLPRLGRVLGLLVAAVLYFVVVKHVTGLYAAERRGVETFLLRDGGAVTSIFWIGQILLGGLVPLGLVFHPSWGRTRRGITAAAALVVVGAFAQLYVIIIGGQSYPLVLFPGMEVESSFFDGVIHSYRPTLVEAGLSIGAPGLAGILVLVGIRLLKFLPDRLPPAAAEEGPAPGA